MASLADINTFHAVFGLGGADALQAHRLAVWNVSPGLPDNQWQAEVEGWFRMNLARLQANVVEFAVKSGGTLSANFEASTREGKLGMWPLTPVQEEQCGNQLVRAVGEVQNFSLVGVLVVVCMSVALVVVDLSLERVVDLVWSRCGRRAAPSVADAREADGKLHLLHAALAAAAGKAKDWELGSWGVPVLVSGGREDAVRFDTRRHGDSGGLASYVESVEKRAGEREVNSKER